MSITLNNIYKVWRTMPVTWVVLYAIPSTLLFNQGQVTGSGLQPEDNPQDSGKVNPFSKQILGPRQ